jgi:hypothetical protein
MTFVALWLAAKLGLYSGAGTEFVCALPPFKKKSTCSVFPTPFSFGLRLCCPAVEVIGFTVSTQVMRLFAGGHFYKYLLTCMPMMLACFVACSRTRDFHHFYADVVGGAVLGLVIAIGCYHLNYPALWEADCHLPRLRCGKSQASRDGAYERLDLLEAGTPTTASPSPPPFGHTAYLTMPATQRSLSPQLQAV